MGNIRSGNWINIGIESIMEINRHEEGTQAEDAAETRPETTSSSELEESVNSHAFLVSKMVEQHHACLYRFAYRLTGSRIDAEDLTQETFLTAQTRFSQLRDRSSARSWLYSILRNLFLKNLRKQHPVSGCLVEEPPAAEVPFTFEKDISPEVLQAAIQELPEEFRTAIVLFYFEEMSYKQIAEFMDVPIGTIMSRLARAKSHLRIRLSPILH